jgi:hypothetical protein
VSVTSLRRQDKAWTTNRIVIGEVECDENDGGDVEAQNSEENSVRDPTDVALEERFGQRSVPFHADNWHSQSGS